MAAFHHSDNYVSIESALVGSKYLDYVHNPDGAPKHKVEIISKVGVILVVGRYGIAATCVGLRSALKVCFLNELNYYWFLK